MSINHPEISIISCLQQGAVVVTDEMLSSILGDPESMQQIKELAEMLSAESGSADSLLGNGSSSDETGGQPEEAAGGADSPGEGFDFSALSGLFGSGGPDIGMIMGLGKALSAAGGDDKNTALLLALRPHLSPERQGRIDKAVKLMKMYSIFLALKDSGMLGQML